MVIVAVASAKGGVGKTTSVANLGTALALLKKHVLAIDGNLTTPNLNIHLGMVSDGECIQDVLKKDVPITKALRVHESGLHVIPASISIRKHPDLSMLKEKISAIKELYDVVLIDCAAGTGEEVLAALRASDAVLVICNPDMVSVISAIKVIKIANSFNTRILGIVLNRVAQVRPEISPDKIEKLCRTKIICNVPFDKDVPRSISKMKPIVLYKPKSKVSKAFKMLAASLVGEVYMKPSVWKSFWTRLISFLTRFSRK
jgi:septum site-determining protein MinD